MQTNFIDWLFNMQGTPWNLFVQYCLSILCLCCAPVMSGNARLCPLSGGSTGIVIVQFAICLLNLLSCCCCCCHGCFLTQLALIELLNGQRRLELAHFSISTFSTFFITEKNLLPDTAVLGYQ